MCSATCGKSALSSVGVRVPVREVPKWLLSVGAALGADLGAALGADLGGDLGWFSATCGESVLSFVGVRVPIRKVPNWLLSVGGDLGVTRGGPRG